MQTQMSMAMGLNGMNKGGNLRSLGVDPGSTAAATAALNVYQMYSYAMS